MISLLSTRCSNIFVGSIKSRWFWKELLDTRRAWFLISNISAISTTNSLQWPNKNSSRHLIWTICKRLCRSLFCFSHRKSHFLIILASDGQLRISNLWNFRKRSYKISRIRASCVSRSFRKARIRSHGPYGRGCWQRYACTYASLQGLTHTQGPLVRASLHAGEQAKRKLRVYAVEKNANAVVTLRNLKAQNIPLPSSPPSLHFFPFSFTVNIAPNRRAILGIM